MFRGLTHILSRRSHGVMLSVLILTNLVIVPSCDSSECSFPTGYLQDHFEIFTILFIF